MTVDDFWNNDEQTNFLDRISSFLNIPTNRLRVVGIKPIGRRVLKENDEDLKR